MLGDYIAGVLDDDVVVGAEKLSFVEGGVVVATRIGVGKITFTVRVMGPVRPAGSVTV